MSVPDQALLDRLLDHQARILHQLDAAAALLLLNVAEAQVPIARTRWTLVRLMREYQLFKHARLFDPTIGRGGPAAAMAVRMKAACITAGETFAAHIRCWSTEDLGARWPDYVVAARLIIAQLRRHIARERREVALLLPPGRPTVPGTATI